MTGLTKATALLVGAAFAAALVTGCGSGSRGSEAPTYHMTVGFTEQVTQEDMDSVADFLRGFDDDLDFLVQEIFPPIGVATVQTDADNFCETVETDLESRSYVREASCDPYVEPADGGDPDEPVSSDADDVRY